MSRTDEHVGLQKRVSSSLQIGLSFYLSVNLEERHRHVDALTCVAHRIRSTRGPWKDWVGLGRYGSIAFLLPGQGFSSHSLTFTILLFFPQSQSSGFEGNKYKTGKKYFQFCLYHYIRASGTSKWWPLPLFLYWSPQFRCETVRLG